MRLSELLGPSALVAVIGLALAGCSAGDPAPSPAPETTPPAASAPPTSEPPAEPTSTAEPTTPAPDPAVACGTVLSDEEHAELAADGLELREEPSLFGPVMERMAADGALLCNWGKPRSDIQAWYAALDVGDAGDAWLADLAAEGWTSQGGDPDILAAPDDYDPGGMLPPKAVLVDGTLYFGSPSIFDAIRF